MCDEIRFDWYVSKNYRGISLLCTGYKILTTVLNNRLKKYTEAIIGEYQAGFRTGKSTTDQTFIVKNLLEKAWEHNVEIHHIKRYAAASPQSNFYIKKKLNLVTLTRKLRAP